jgi:hypothetical protein
MRRLREVKRRTATALRLMAAFTAREKQFLVAEFSQVRGLMPLLMKPRNRQRWSPDDRAQILQHLRRLTRISPYLAVLVLPGGLVMLPVLAWWLDRRRGRARVGVRGGA